MLDVVEVRGVVVVLISSLVEVVEITILVVLSGIVVVVLSLG